MSRRRILAIGVVTFAVVLSGRWVLGDPLVEKDAKRKAADKIALKANAFDLRDVRLLDGPFKKAMELNLHYLLSFDVDTLLHTFRLNAGLPSTAKPLGGWEEPKSVLRGEFTGHYLSACAMMYASTGDARLKERCDALVAGLAECQAKIGTGYLSAFPEEYVASVEKGKPICVAYYCLHKIYAGLLDTYDYCDNPQALEMCKKAADWLIARNTSLTDEQLQKMLSSEHGGINEVLANLYTVTGEEKYLKVAQRFNHKAVLEPASKQVDALDNLHANTQIPKFIGVARQYEITGDDWQKTAAGFFWDTVVHERSYVTGGNSNDEAFSPKSKLSEAFGPRTTETCNTYNMLKLTKHLFCWDPKAEYADYYERALYNHILASQNPDNGMMVYYLSLQPGQGRGQQHEGAHVFLGYCTPFDSCWCCTGTGVENHAKYGESIYFHDADSLYWNLFIASELNWKAKGLKLRQETKYPDESTATLKIACEKPTEWTLHIRRPQWATAGFEIRVNGQVQNIESRPGSYANLTRQWNNGDSVEVSMPFALHTEGFRDNPKRFALMYGPLVLSTEVDAKLRPDVEFRKPYPGVTAEGNDLLASLQPVAGRPSTFAGPASVFHVPGNESHAITFEPFYKMHGERHAVVYWNAYTPAEWIEAEKSYHQELDAMLAHEKDMAERTVDYVDPAKPESERNHQLQGEHTEAGGWQDRMWRHATNGGWFAWTLKTLPDQPMQLQATYWGSDVGREFDVLVDGVKIASQKLDNNRPGQLFEVAYPIPKEQTQGKATVTVRFQGRPGNVAGGVFECRTMKAK